MFNKFLLIVTAILLLGCSDGCNEQDVYIKDLGKRAVNLNASNNFYYHPLLLEQIRNREDEQLLNNVMDISLTVDTLAMLYIEQSGGIMQDGSIYEINTKGERGLAMYNDYNLRQRIVPMLNSINNLQTSESKKLVDVVNNVVNENFLNSPGTFQNEKLSSTPFAVLSLELSLIENLIYSCVLEHIYKNPKTTE